MSPKEATAKQNEDASASPEKHYVTLEVDGLLLGVEIERVQEINRIARITRVPGAPDAVRGVMNLRGEVVSVVDLRPILHAGRTEETKVTRIVVVEGEQGGEKVGLLVDAVGEVIPCKYDTLEPKPCHLDDWNANYFSGVVQLEDRLLVVLDVSAIMDAEGLREVAKTELEK